MNIQPSRSVFEDFVAASGAPATKSSDATELVAGIIHDFNNILQVIQAHAVLIESRPGAEQEIYNHAGVIKETVNEGVLLVRQLTGEPKAQSRSEVTDINELLQRTMKSLAPVFPGNIAVALELDPRAPLIQFNAGLMYQVFLNLCMNAREAMPVGGNILVKTSTVSGAALRQSFPEAGAERYVAVTVADTGLGMEAEVTNRIFQLHFTSKKPSQGSGVGLSIVQRAVSRYKGFIDVTSEPGRGSTFRIYLPGLERQSAMTKVPTGSRQESRAPIRGTILYAEDDERLVGLMQRFLEKQGVKIVTAQDGIQALDVYSRHSDEISAAVLDSHLPKLDGWAAFQMMRKINPKLKGILASGFVSAEAESRVAKGELSGVLQKPYFGAELLAAIKDVIRSE